MRHLSRFAAAAVAVVLTAFLVPVVSGSSVASAGAPYACVNSTALTGVTCSFPQDSTDFYGINNEEGQNPETVGENDIDQWNNGGGSTNYCNNGTYKLRSNGGEDWKLQTYVPEPTEGNDGVCAYPNFWEHDAEGFVNFYSKITASFTESFPHTADVQAHGMEDDWFNGNPSGGLYGPNLQEVMIQYDFSNEAPCSSPNFPQTDTNLSFGGEYGVPVQSWHICSNASGSTIDFKLGADDAHLASESTGKLDILPMLNWAETHTNPETGLAYLQPYPGDADAFWSGWSMGFEINSTDLTGDTAGQTPVNFDVSSAKTDFQLAF